MESLNSKTEKLEDKDIAQAERNLERAKKALKNSQTRITRALNELEEAQKDNAIVAAEYRNAHQYLFRLQQTEAEENTVDDQ